MPRSALTQVKEAPWQGCRGDHRFMGCKKDLDGAAVQRGVHPRPRHDFVFVATIPATDGIDIVGVGQYVRAGESNDRNCEFAIAVAEGWRGIGLALGCWQAEYSAHCRVLGEPNRAQSLRSALSRR
jgi:hypothetical protein